MSGLLGDVRKEEGATPAKRRMTLNLTEAEMAVLEALREKRELRKTALLRNGLWMYQVMEA